MEPSPAARKLIEELYPFPVDMETAWEIADRYLKDAYLKGINDAR